MVEIVPNALTFGDTVGRPVAELVPDVDGVPDPLSDMEDDALAEGVAECVACDVVDPLLEALFVTLDEEVSDASDDDELVVGLEDAEANTDDDDVAEGLDESVLRVDRVAPLVDVCVADKLALKVAPPLVVGVSLRVPEEDMVFEEAAVCEGNAEGVTVAVALFTLVTEEVPNEEAVLKCEALAVKLEPSEAVAPEAEGLDVCAAEAVA